MIALVPHIVRTPRITAAGYARRCGRYRSGGEADLFSPRSGALRAGRARSARQRRAGPGARGAARRHADARALSGGNRPAALAFNTSALQVALARPAMVTLQAQNVVDLYSAPIQVKWDPKLLRLNQVTAGTLIGDGGAEVNPPSIDIRNDTGEASITLSRIAGVPGVNGTGPLATLSFIAVGKGTGTHHGDASRPEKLQATAHPVTAPAMAITVQ